MTLKTGTIGIISDDLTGANDTALQFHLSGCNTQILFDYSIAPEGKANTQAWAISTETRNIDAQSAAKIVSKATRLLMDNLNIEYLYKKIDSTLRGNVAQESLAVINAVNWDAAVIVPAFPAEGRTTVGGYHLLKGVPIERTEVARDPQSPIYESHIPTLLKQQIDNPDLVSHIQLTTVMKGAGPILVELQELIKKNKKLIVIDAVSTTDMEQIALAIEKSNFNILPCGSAGLAQAITKFWLPEMKHQHITKVLPSLPILIIVGSATNITKTQIKKLMESDEFEPYIIGLDPKNLLIDPPNELIDRIINDLGSNEIVLVHSAPLEGDINEIFEYANQQGVQTENLPGIVSDYLANLTQKVVNRHNLILVLIGGETSYKCCNAINSKHLQLIDEVDPVIPLCLDHKAQWIVTKSGNLGTPNTLINILKYFKKHQEAK
ncbi:MAG: four-carbon acid sugar kinase family protein [bacterium]